MSSRKELLARIADESQRHYAAWTVFNQAMADHLGLHPTDLQCLGLLGMEPEPLSTGQVAKLTGLTAGSATRLVDRLEKSGLVVRTADPGDRRRALVALAPEALTRVGEAWDEPGEAFTELLDGYNDHDLDVIADFLGRATELGRNQAARLSSGR